jgi:chromate reductase, NAD(P)H dehydrogenase (quinone)
MTQPTFRIVGIAGSLRRESYNRALLRAAQRLAPPGVVIEAFERLGEIPPYNDDVRLRGLPDPVSDLWQRIADADAVLIATPEYNYGVPGVLKNAIDWVSRPPAESPLRHKPVAVMGASTGNYGTARAQLGLRHALLYLEAYGLLKPEVAVFRAAERFDDAGEITDETTRALVAQLVQALVAWAFRLNATS